MKIIKKLTQISGIAIRLTLGIGGAALILLAVAEGVKKRTSGRSGLNARAAK